jgi:hypothetical protein
LTVYQTAVHGDGIVRQKITISVGLNPRQKRLHSGEIARKGQAPGLLDGEPGPRGYQRFGQPLDPREHLGEIALCQKVACALRPAQRDDPDQTPRSLFGLCCSKLT